MGTNSKVQVKMLTANIKDWSLYLSLFVLIYCTNTGEQHFSTSEGQSVSMLHQYFAKWTREATPWRVCVSNFATFTEKCDWVDDTTLKLKPRLIVFSRKLFMTSFHSEETCEKAATLQPLSRNPPETNIVLLRERCWFLLLFSCEGQVQKTMMKAEERMNLCNPADRDGGIETGESPFPVSLLNIWKWAEDWP